MKVLIRIHVSMFLESHKHDLVSYSKVLEFAFRNGVRMQVTCGESIKLADFASHYFRVPHFLQFLTYIFIL